MVDDLILQLYEALGRWSVEICRPDAELAPPPYLIEAIDALEEQLRTNEKRNAH